MKSRGFTLIELVVVIGIIAVLTGLVTFNFQQARGRARDIQRKNDLKAMQKALELYKSDQSPEVYPGGTGNTRLDVGLYNVVGASYIKRLPVDPRESASSGSWYHYTYQLLSPTTYEMTACLENSSDNECDSPVSVCATSGCLMTVTQP